MMTTMQLLFTRDAGILKIDTYNRPQYIKGCIGRPELKSQIDKTLAVKFLTGRLK